MLINPIKSGDLTMYYYRKCRHRIEHSNSWDASY